MDGDVFQAISAPARREMLAHLAVREMPVLELAESFDMTLSAVSQHLSVLKQAGLVRARKEGRQRYYSLEPAPLRDVAAWIRGYEQFWEGKMGALGEYLDEAAARKTKE